MRFGGVLVSGNLRSRSASLYNNHWLSHYVLFVRSLSPSKLAGLAPQNFFAGILQIRRGTMIANKNLKKKFHGKCFELFLVKFFLVKFFHEIAECSVAISEYVLGC
jgi:hypothetical protein